MQTPENVLGALIKQIVRGRGGISTEISSAFQKAKGQVGGRGLRVPAALELLKASIAPLDRAFICVDALDELLVKHLPTLLRSLHNIAQSCPRVRFLFTGRPHIGVEIEKYFPGAARFIQMTGAKQDIMRYVEMMLDDDPNSEAMNTGLRAEIMNGVSETISDVYVAAIFRSKLQVSLIGVPRFLLVSLNMTAILEETTIYDRRERLKRMTSGQGLNDAYSVMLDRIKGQTGGKLKLGMAALMWISRSERPMSADELCDALGVQMSSSDHNHDSIPSMQTLLASCLGLVTVDEEESKVRLVHFTLQEHLNSCSDIFQNPYAVMAEVCLTYLNFSRIRKLPPTLNAALHIYPFLWHASCYWGHYARHQTTEGVKSRALQLLDGFGSHISANLLLHRHFGELARNRRYPLEEVDIPEGFTGLHCVAFLGLNEIADAVLNIRDWDVDKADSTHRTPLIWASVNGCEGIIRLLLEKAGADVNTRDTMYGRTALSWAIEYGQEGVAKLFLERDEIDPELGDRYGRTSLNYAARCGTEGTVKLLLEREEVDPESRDNSGRTPLSHAARYGREGAVKLLLEREEVNPDSRDKFGGTPLSNAAEIGSEGTVRLLLEREEVNPESRDNSGRTPLLHTARVYRGEKIAKLLLEREEVNPESRDNSGRTPLSHAVQHRREGAVKLLLDQEEVNPESRDNSGRTPLSYAVGERNSQEVVQLLLERGEANPESRDNSGRTPLSHAVEFGREGAVKLLLEREEVNPESRDNSGRTPLSHAAGVYDNGKTVKLLLERGEINPESRDNSGRTPLSYAAGQYESEEVVQLLLGRGEVNPESRDNSGRTPLSYLVEFGREGTVRLLLGREVNVESRDDSGRTPFSHAVEFGREGTVRLLLEREEVNPESWDNSGRTPLSHAAEFGVQGRVKLLLERGEVNPESRDNSGRTPLSYAASAEEGEEAVELLLEREEVNPESRDNAGRTPLSHAAEFGGEGTVKLLLGRRVVNPESRDNSGRTPLSHAAEFGGEGTVKLLLEQEVNPESLDNSGRTPLSHAAGGYESEGALRLLLDREEVNIESRDNSGRTPRFYARGEALTLLSEHGRS